MSLSLGFGSDEAPNWGTSPEPMEADIVTTAMKKEQVIKEIATAQEDLRALYTKVKTIQGDVDKLASGNETLQMYIDNLTIQMAKRR